jgi:hypothetical protein
MAEDLLGLGKAAEALVKQFAELARPLLEPAAKEAGDILADQLRYIRLKRMVASMERARKLLDEKGIAPKMVPSKIFFPKAFSSKMRTISRQCGRGYWHQLLVEEED